jgi:hypothetical protein
MMIWRIYLVECILGSRFFWTPKLGIDKRQIWLGGLPRKIPLSISPCSGEPRVKRKPFPGSTPLLNTFHYLQKFKASTEISVFSIRLKSFQSALLMSVFFMTRQVVLFLAASPPLAITSVFLNYAKSIVFLLETFKPEGQNIY